jgi:hypothetical protein
LRGLGIPLLGLNESIDIGDFFLQVATSQPTVFSDGDQDKLAGGSSRDWFFAKKIGQKKDKITDLGSNELVDEP